MTALRFLAVLIALPTLAGVVPEAMDARLQQARATYDERIAEAIASIHRKLEARENQARARGDKKLVDQIKGESKAVDESLTVPTSVDVDAPLSEIKRARSALLGEFDQAIKECLKEKADEEANYYEQQKNDFIRGFLRAHRGIAGSLGTLWVHPTGSFEENAKGTWVETLKGTPPKQLHFQSAKRMNDHVVLQDPSAASTLGIGMPPVACPSVQMSYDIINPKT